VDHSELLQQIKDRIALETYAMRYVSNMKKSGGWYKACCPFHQDETPSFAINIARQTWQCFGTCNDGGDLVSFAMRANGWDFKTAVSELAKEAGLDPSHRSSARRSAPPRQQPREEAPAQPPSVEWQDYAERIVRRAQATLFSEKGWAAYKYLNETRGLTENTIRAARLGYVPAANDIDAKYGRVIFDNWLKDDGKPRRVPCGITIPHIVNGAVWGVRVRTDSGQPKYGGIEGGQKALYWADHVMPGTPVVITEGEFDALILWQTSMKLWIDVSVVSLCSAANKDINRVWWRYLQGAPELFLRADDDAAGAAAVAALRTVSASVRAIQVPETKDINDYHQKYGTLAVCNWIECAMGIQTSEVA